MDEQKRDLERAAASGDHEADGRLIQAKIRSGELSRGAVELATFLGHEGARLALGSPAKDAPRNPRERLEVYQAGPFMDDGTWLGALVHYSTDRPDLVVRACAALLADELKNHVPPFPATTTKVRAAVEPLIAAMDLIALGWLAMLPGGIRPEHSLVAGDLALVSRHSMRITHAASQPFRAAIRSAGRGIGRGPVVERFFQRFDDQEWRLDAMARGEHENDPQPTEAVRILQWFGRTLLVDEGHFWGKSVYRNRAAISSDLATLVLNRGDQSLTRIAATGKFPAVLSAIETSLPKLSPAKIVALVEFVAFANSAASRAWPSRRAPFSFLCGTCGTDRPCGTRTDWVVEDGVSYCCVGHVPRSREGHP